MMQRVSRGIAFCLALGLLLVTAVPPGMTQEYSVSPGDVLEISVLGEPEVSGPVTVSPDGKIALPMVGELTIAGLTLPQLTEKVATALKQYIKDPHVAVTIRQAAKKYVYVLGEAVHPGAYAFEENWTAVELVAVAGGPTAGANLPHATILRKGTTIPVDLQQVLVDGNTSASVALQPGDVLILPESKNRVVVMGAVAKPGPYLFRDGDRVVDALSSAGGPTSNAVLGNIGVVRRVGGKPTVEPVNLSKFYKDGDAHQNVVLEPGDIVYVPEKANFNWADALLGPLLYFFR